MGLDPWSENQDPTSLVVWPKEENDYHPAFISQAFSSQNTLKETSKSLAETDIHGIKALDALLLSSPTRKEKKVIYHQLSYP